jgi:predicted P-loop ATPase
MTTLESAQELFKQGFCLVRLRNDNKQPLEKGWPDARFTPDDLPKYFSNGSGFGVQMGVVASDEESALVPADVDLDCPESLMASKLIPGPATERTFGHALAPESHLIYLLPWGFEKLIREDPIRARDNKGKPKQERAKEMLVELRGKGGQTVFPPTIHAQGGERVWTRKGEFGRPGYSELVDYVNKIAAAALLARYSTDRHDEFMAIAGVFARYNVAEQTALEIVTTAAQIRRPQDRDSLRWASGVVRETYKRASANERAVAFQTYAQIVGGESALLIWRAIEKWFQLRDTPPAAASSVSVGASPMQTDKPKPILLNAIKLISESAEWTGVLGFNEFTLQAVARKSPPWRKAATSQWNDTDDLNATAWMQAQGLLVRPSTAAEACHIVATQSPFHPVRDYLNALKWDGEKRIAFWLSWYLGVEPTEYSWAVGVRWLTSAVARIFRPGCRADYTLVFVGPQGIEKSTALRTLAVNDEWFSDHIADLGSKDSRQQLQGRWIIEIAELASVKRAGLEQMKAFLTCVSDKFRPPYGRHAQEFPRHNVFAGSVNDAAFLADETGNRRFWPVKVESIDVGKIERYRDQLWAEAVTQFRAGEKWWLDTRELNEAAEQEQEKHYQPGVWDDAITRWLKSPEQASEKSGAPITPFTSTPERTTVEEILLHAIQKPTGQMTQADRNAVVRCLTHLGWQRRREANTGRRFYVKPVTVVTA